MSRGRPWSEAGRRIPGRRRRKRRDWGSGGGRDGRVEGDIRSRRADEEPLEKWRGGAKSHRAGGGGRRKYQRVNAHREAAQFNGMVSGRPAPASGTACAPLGPPDTTFFISRTTPPRCWRRNCPICMATRCLRTERGRRHHRLPPPRANECLSELCQEEIHTVVSFVCQRNMDVPPSVKLKVAVRTNVAVTAGQGRKKGRKKGTEIIIAFADGPGHGA